MRIAINGMFWDKGATGSGQYIRQLLPALVDVVPGMQCTLFVPGGAAAAAAQTPGPWGVRTLATPFDGGQANLAKLWFEQVAFAHACRNGFDLAHVPYLAPPRYSAVATIVTIHDLIPLLLPEYRGSRGVQLYMRLVSEAARHSARVLTDSHASARDIETLLDIPTERIHVVYLAAASIYQPRTVQEQEPVLARLHIPRPYLLYLGGFDPRKNVSGLLRAFAALSKVLPHMHLVIAGKLPDRSNTLARDPRPMIHELGLDDRVHLTGWVEEQDSPTLYAGAIAFVFPSYYEGFGLPVLEAISCGTPSVVGAGSSLEEVGGAGCIAVDPQDHMALCDAMRRLCEDEGYRHELALAGLAHARRFSWAETARQTWAAYQATVRGT